MDIPETPSAQTPPAPASAAFCQPNPGTFHCFSKAAPIVRVWGGTRGDVWLCIVITLLFIAPPAAFRLIGQTAAAGTIPIDALYAIVWIPAIVIVIVLFIRWHRSESRWSRTPIRLNEEDRLVVIATPAEALRLKDVHDQFFEPIVFRLSHAIDRMDDGPGSTRSTLLQRSGAADALPYVAAWAASLCAFELSWRAISGAWMSFNYISILLSAAMARLMLGWLRPTYLRFVPGRVDVIRYGWFGRAPARFRSYDLRTTGRRIRICMWSLAFADPPAYPFADPEWRSIEWADRRTMSGSLRRLDIARAALMAALSTRTPAPLPEGELLG